MFSSNHRPFLLLCVFIIRERGFLIKVYLKTDLTPHRRNNLHILGTSYIYTNASFYFFQLFGLPVSSGSNPIICAIIWNNTKRCSVPASVELGPPLRHYLILLFPAGASYIYPPRPLLLSALSPAHVHGLWSWDWVNQCVWIKCRKPVPAAGTGGLEREIACA